MELVSLESAEEAQQLADYLRPGKSDLTTSKYYPLLSVVVIKV